MIILAEKSANADRATLAHLTLELIDQGAHLFEQVFLALSEGVLLVLNIVHLLLVLLDKFAVAFPEDGKGALLLVLGLTVDLGL